MPLFVQVGDTAVNVDMVSSVAIGATGVKSHRRTIVAVCVLGETRAILAEFTGHRADHQAHDLGRSITGRTIPITGEDN